MLPPYDLLVGLTLLQEKSQKLDTAISGWNGVLVQVADKYLLVERASLKEIVSTSKVTKVIDHRSWLVGLMSYEGAIIPLIELTTLINEKNTTLGLDDRSVLVISRQGGHVGLLVDRVLGSRDYWSDNAELSHIKTSAKGFCKISFVDGDQLIEVFDVEKLATVIGLKRKKSTSIA